VNFQAEAAAEERSYIERLVALNEIRQRKATLTKEDTKLSGELKQWMQLNDREELRDEERGIRAHFQSRSTTEWDIRSLAKNNPQVLIALASEGYLSGNTTLIDAARKAAPSSVLDELQRYRITGQTVALMVEVSTK